MLQQQGTANLQAKLPLRQGAHTRACGPAGAGMRFSCITTAERGPQTGNEDSEEQESQRSSVLAIARHKLALKAE